MNTCCHCGAPSYSDAYCDPCNTDACLAMGDDGETYCRLAPTDDELEPAEPDYEAILEARNEDRQPWYVNHPYYDGTPHRG